MRTYDIKIHLEIPVNVADKNQTFTDCNGVVYTIDAIKRACERAKDIPLTVENEQGVSVIVGVVNSLVWNPGGFIEASGHIQYGGTCETVDLSPEKEVVSMKVTEVGISQK